MTMEINPNDPMNGDRGHDAQSADARGASDLTFDVAILGGGLAGGLAALAMRKAPPEVSLCLIEPQAIGGNHIWSYFDGDLSAAGLALLEPLRAYRWAGYDVRFPSYQRDINMAYNSLSGEHLAAAVEAAMPAGAILRAAAVDVRADAVRLSDGRSVAAKLVVDARGFGALDVLDAGWQKFVGQALTIKGGHGLTQPIVMDATVEQIGGYRFVYSLPFDAETVFVEDTYYSDGPDLDVDAVKGRIADYAAAQGWQVSGVARTETGVLPVVMAGEFEAIWPADQAVATIGVRSGQFHATTGYSLPFAVESALALPELVGRSDAAQVMRAQAKSHWQAQRFYRLLSTMLFRASEPEQRYKIFERFYRLSPELVARFYAGGSPLKDRLRILSGKPPVPVGRAVAAIKDLKWI